MLALLLLAAVLGLDNLAAAVGIGAGGVRGALRVRIAVVFGLFEAGMPVLGLLLGHGLAGLAQAGRADDSGDSESRPPGRRDREPVPPTRQPLGRLLAGGLVLSADNLAAGFALGAYHVSVALAAMVFGVVSVAMSLAGLELGTRIGAAAGERGELVACGLLVVVGGVIAAGLL